MEKVQRFTVVPSGVVGTTPPTAVVLVPPAGSIEDGFALAQKLLGTHACVRVVGVGVTIEGTWPDWVRDTTQGVLETTELGAYRSESRVTGGGPFRIAVERWLDEVFEGATSRLRGSDVFYASAMARFIEQHHDAYGIANALAEHHGAAEIHSMDPHWHLLDALSTLITPRGGRVHRAPQPSSEQAWRIRFMGLWLAGQAASLSRLVSEFKRSKEARERVQSHQPDPSARSPSTWIVVTGDWWRVNRHVLDGIAVPELEAGRPIGVLLFGGIARGARSETASGARVGDELWPGLAGVRDHLERCVLEQVVQPASWSEVGRLAVRATLRSARVGGRILLRSSGLGVPEYPVRPGRYRLELAKLATVEVLRATIAEHATERVIRRHDFRKSAVFFAGAQFADIVAVDLLLQQAGATTFDFRHGSITDDWAGCARSRASYSCVWTQADAASIGELGRQAFVTGSPYGPLQRIARAGRVRRVLFLTNFTHWGSRIDGRSPYECFQEEMLRVADALSSARGDGVDLRWRPHPADDPEAIARGLKQHPSLTQSTSRSCQEDFAWADVVIGSISTTIVEALLGGVPVFVHLPPDFVDITPTAFVHTSRRFFWARDVIAPILQCLEGQDRNEDVLGPERHALAKLFGNGPTTASPGSIVERARQVVTGSDVKRAPLTANG